MSLPSCARGFVHSPKSWTHGGAGRASYNNQGAMPLRDRSSKVVDGPKCRAQLAHNERKDVGQYKCLIRYSQIHGSVEKGITVEATIASQDAIAKG